MWVADASAALRELRAASRLAIFVGGTGLYFKALTHGLAAVPPTPQAVRDAVRLRLEREGIEVLHDELAARDPAMGAAWPSRPGPGRRALEVIDRDGALARRLAARWPRSAACRRIERLAVFLAPEREAVYARIDARFDRDDRAGRARRSEALAARRLDPVLPAMKAHGVPWLIRHLAGEVPLAAAVAAAQADTRHYAKRQFTWFRHQLGHWPQVAPAEAFSYLRSALAA